MKKIILLLVVLLTAMLTSCTTTPPKPKIDFPPGTTIGVMLAPRVSKLWHNYTGLTVFQEFDREYDIGLDVTALSEKSFVDVANANGHKAIIIRDESVSRGISDYGVFNGYEGFAFHEDSKLALQKFAQERGIDVLIFYAMDVDESILEGQLCTRCVGLKSAQNGFGKVSIRAGQAYRAIIVSTMDDWIAPYYMTTAGVVVEKTKFIDKKALNQAELDRLNPAIQQSLHDGVRAIFHAVNLGEFAYKPRFVFP